MCLSETKDCDHASWAEFRRLTGWSVLSCSRARELSPSGGFTSVSGGVAVINCSPHYLTIRELAADSRGLLSVDVSCPQSSFSPILVSVMYLAPAGSPFQSLNDAVISSLSSVLDKAEPQYNGEVLVLGDFNVRMGPKDPAGNPRATADATRQLSSCKLLLPCLRSHALAPLMGRAPESPAPCTSRSISGVRQGRAEVDYICGRDDLDPQRYTVLPVESWRSLPKAMTHLGIGIEYLPLPTTAQHILSSLQRPGRRWKDPVYCDRDSWAKVANCIQEELKNVLPTLYSFRCKFRDMN